MLGINPTKIGIEEIEDLGNFLFLSKNMKSSRRMTMGCHTCDKDKCHRNNKSKDIFAELTCARQEAEHVLALKQRMNSLRDRLEALENQAREEKIKQNKLVLRDLVKEARTKIFEVTKYSITSFSILDLEDSFSKCKVRRSLA